MSDCDSIELSKMSTYRKAYQVDTGINSLRSMMLPEFLYKIKTFKGQFKFRVFYCVYWDMSNFKIRSGGGID